MLAVLVGGILLLPAALYPTLDSAQIAELEMTDKERLDARNDRYVLQSNSRQALVQAVVALIGISGAVLAWRQYFGQREDRRDDVHMKLWGDALAGLRAEDVSGRVGALYLLERVARASPNDKRASAQVLESYVHERCRRTAVDGPAAESGIPLDVHTALTLLTRHPPWWWGVEQYRLARLDLCDVDLPGAHLEGADLSSTNMQGATLDHAELAGAQLRGTLLMDAHLRGADLSHARMVKSDLSHATVDGWVLTGAEVDDVIWPPGYDRERALLEGAQPAGTGSAGTSTTATEARA